MTRDGWEKALLYKAPDLEEAVISANYEPDWLFPLILNFTKSKEGFMRRPYICPAGMLTVGYGHVILKSSEFKTWSEKQAHEQLISDFNKKKEWVIKNAPAKCKEYQLWSLTMLAMNCRMNKWKSSSLREEVWEYIYIPNRSSFTELQTKWTAWCKIRNPKTGKKWKSKALLERRQLEYLIFTGQWQEIRKQYGHYIPTA
jgi:lysozyme